MAFEQARQYLARVVPWDGVRYVSIHHKFDTGRVGHDGKKLFVFPGKPCLGMDAAVGTLEYYTQAGKLADLYVSMASQKATTPKQGPRGVYHAALRTIENAAFYKSLYMDLDVKSKGGYATPSEAKIALKEFLAWSKLPPPTIIVASGTGGLHVYWTMTEAFPQSVWSILSGALINLALQFGLLFDSQCTVDPVRLLRPPNTWNLKQSEPLPVELLYASPSDLFLERLQTALAPYVGAQPLTHGSKSASKDADPNDDLSAGIVKNTLPPSDIDTVASVCPFLLEELATGGANTTQPLWFLTLRLASCCTEPNATAHRLSAGHHTYSAEETEDMLGRLIQEKVDKPSLGPPRCIKLQQAGAKQCSTCPHLPLNKSPLNVPGAFAIPNPTLSITLNGSPLLPVGYSRGLDGLIYITELNDDGASTQVLIFPYQIINPWAEGGREYALNFTTVEETNELKHVRIPFVGLSDKNITAKSLAGEGLPLKVTDRVQDFMVSFIKQLRDTAGIVRCEPLGWYEAKGEVVGFAYDQTCYTKNGEQIAQALDPTIRVHYTPTGSGEAWLEAVRIINTQKRPALDTLILSAFASPLISFAGQPGVSIGGWSTQSGVGKTTALQLAQAVWGHPVKGSGGLNDTANATFRRAGLTRNLPLIWDEIKTQKQTQTFVETIFTMTSGREKARLNRSARQAHQGEWQAILTYASNSSMTDAIIDQTKSTTAGHVRVFEFKVLPADRNQALVSHMAALIDKLRTNYGHAGLVYARFLGENHTDVRARVKAIQVKLEDETRAKEDERFWIALMAATLAAAVYANRLGLTEVDIPVLKAWLLKEFNRMRGHKDLAPNDFSKASNIVHTLAKFMAEKRAHNTITTDTIPMGRGKPIANSIKIVGDGPNVDRIGTLQVQIGQNPKVIRIADSALGEWCVINNIPKSAMVDGMKELLAARYANLRLGSGTRLSGITEPVWELSVAGTDLDQAMDW